MTRQRKGALLAFGVAIVFIVSQILFGIQTAFAGLFVAGLAGGLLIGEEMAKDTKHTEEKAGG